MVLPLTVTRRCPKLHVALAQGLVPDLEALHDAPEGEILQVGNEEAVRMMGPTDMVICRVNRYLVPAAYALIKRGIKAVIRGRDIGKNLVALIDSLHAADIYDLHRRIADYEYRETAKLEALGDKGAPLLEELKDRVGCVIALCEGVTTMSQMMGNGATMSCWAPFTEPKGSRPTMSSFWRRNLFPIRWQNSLGSASRSATWPTLPRRDRNSRGTSQVA
jgi:hypothetical protein